MAHNYDSSLPTEILEIIIEEVKLEYKETKPERSHQVTFIPRWYITPILRISKLWYAVGAKYLCQAVAVGSSAPFHHQRFFKQGTRKGYMVTERLSKTLQTNSRIASLVEKLQLGIEHVAYEQRLKWMQMNIRILQLCPNVADVEIRGWDSAEHNGQAGALLEKPVVSFSMSAMYLSQSARGEGGSLSQIFHVMQKLPKLRSIRVERFLAFGETEYSLTPVAPDCCSFLREIITNNTALHASDYKALLSMCSGGVEKLVVSLYGTRVGSDGDAAVNALCECLRAWSLTLQCFKMDALQYRPSYQPLVDAITTLRELREFRSNTMKVDFGSIYRLPKLECFFCIACYNREELETLSSLLENSENFSSL